MREINKISEALFEKIRDRFEDVSLGDENAKATQDPQKARFFNFDYVIEGHNHGNITLSVIDEISLKVYFSKNISDDLSDDEKKEWYSFLRELREFAKRNLLSFEPRDITRSTLKHRDLQQVSKADDTYSKDDVISEGRMYGTMNRSYEDFGPVRIKVAHAKPVLADSHGARARNIGAIFVENEQGERFRMPFNSLIGTRAMARHISAGGTPSDEFGQHICEMVNEMMKLRPFVHSMRHRTFEDSTTKEMLESAFEYHAQLKNSLKKMKGKRGYNEYKESYQPALVESDDYDEEEVREKFVKKVFPDKLAEALPIVHKAYAMKKENANPYLQQFESWATQISEGTWAVADTPEKIKELVELLKVELPVGIDAENATNLLYNLVGNDDLFDQLGELADKDPEADARETVMSWIESNMPELEQKISAAIEETEPVKESDTGDTPIDAMSRAELLDYLSMTTDEAKDMDDSVLRAAANEKAEALAENTYGSAMGGMDGVVYHESEYCDACDRPAKQCVCEDYDEDQVESIATAIIRRILNNIGQHKELLMKAGPDGVMNAARDVASFHAPVEELGSSDISAMVREVYNEVGVDYPEAESSVFESAWSKLIEEDDYDEYEDDEEEDQGFFVAISSEEDGVFIGMVVKEDGKWRERRYKGNPPYNWGGTYMGYLTPQDVMTWINKDYGRSYEVEGPMDEDEANEYLDYMSEGIVDKVRGANYKRLAKRSFDKAYDAHQDSIDAPKTPAERRSARAEFNKQYDKGVTREKLAKELGEGRVKEVSMDLEDLTDEEFQAKYGKTKEEMKAALSETQGQDYVNRDEKLKRMGAKDLGVMDKLKNIPRGMAAMAKGDSEDELVLYNKGFIKEMRRLAGL